MMGAREARKRRHLLRGMPKAVQEELKNGWQIEVTSGNHVRWRHVTGAVVIAASTPSDHRAWKNHLAQLRAALRP